MLHDALELCTDGPAAIRFSKTAPPDDDDGVGSGLSARRVRAGSDDLPHRRRQDARGRHDGRRAARAEGHDVTVWDPRVVKPLDPEMLADAAGHRLVVTIEDGLRDGGAGSAIADALRKLASDRRPAGAGAGRAVGVPRRTASPTRSSPGSASTPTASSTRCWRGSRPRPAPSRGRASTDVLRPDGRRSAISRRGSRPLSWSVASTTSVTSGIASRIARWMPSLSVAALTAQPWQPPPMVTYTMFVVVDTVKRGEAAVRGQRRVDRLLEQLGDLLGDRPGELESTPAQRVGPVGVADDQARPGPAVVGRSSSAPRRSSIDSFGMATVRSPTR